MVERALNANFRLGGAERAQVLANYAANDKATPEMRAEALTQLGLWAKVPQRDRIVGIYRPLPARDGKPAADALTGVLPKLFGAAPESGAARGASKPLASLELKGASSACSPRRSRTRRRPRPCARPRSSSWMLSAATTVLGAVEAAREIAVPRRCGSRRCRSSRGARPSARCRS